VITRDNEQTKNKFDYFIVKLIDGFTSDKISFIPNSQQIVIISDFIISKAKPLNKYINKLLTFVN